MNKHQPAINSNYVQPYIEYLKQKGHDLDRLSKAMEVDIKGVLSSNRVMTLGEISRLIETTSQKNCVPNGLALGNKMSLSVHGMAGVAAMTQPTYGECLKMAPYFCEMACPAIAMEYFETDDSIGVKIIENCSLAPYSHVFFESVTLSFYNILHFLLGNSVEPQYVSFCFPEPSYRKLYDNYFSCPLRFNAEFTTFVVSKELASRKLLLANQNLAKRAEQDFLENSATSLQHETFIEKFRKVLIQGMGNFPNVDDAARKLGMSGRTLRRRLSHLNTNFQSELDSVRREFAVEYLTESNKCITDIALLLGYCDSSAFSKAFKKWSGLSPREFKKDHLAMNQNKQLTPMKQLRSIASKQELPPTH